MSTFKSRWTECQPPIQPNWPVSGPDTTDKKASVSIVSDFKRRIRRGPHTDPLLEAASDLLTAYRRLHLTHAQWLERFDMAHAACVATFPRDRQHNALRTYRAHYVVDQPWEVVAAHAIALELWTAEQRARGFGHYLEAAFAACGLKVPT
jgi:hypothetical protein